MAKRQGYNNKTGFANILDAIGESHTAKVKADTELKTAILKHYYEKQIDQNAKLAEQNAQQQTPEQQYLRRRALQENPLIATMGQDQQDPQGGGTVEFPASVDQGTPVMQKNGLYQDKPLNAMQIEDNKGKAFMALLNNLQSQGKTPPDWMIQAGEKIKGRMNKRLGYKQEKPMSPKDKLIQDLINESNSQDGGSKAAPKSQYQVGQAVMYQGKPHKIIGIKDDGSLEIDPA